MHWVRATHTGVIVRARRLPLCVLLSLALSVHSLLSCVSGAGSAFFGRETAMALTVAVEEVIGDHYNAQLREMHERGYTQEERDIQLRTYVSLVFGSAYAQATHAH